MTAGPEPFDCTIVGGGPAGAALAWLLAGRGVRTLLLADERRTGPAPRETLLAAARRGLAASGLWQLVADAAEPDPYEHGAIWGSDTLIAREPGERGLLLVRARFDARLRAAAAARGATVAERQRVVAIESRDAHQFVRCEHEHGTGTFATRRLVLATGRRLPRALVELTEVAAGPATAAVTLVGAQPAAAGSAVVEAVPQGWWWWIGDGAGGGAATLLVDGDHLAAVGAKRLVAAARAAARGPVAALCAANVVAATPATARSVATTAPVLLLGDAAATIDPLASQGVEKALAAADHAAAAVVTSLRRPALWPRLCAFHRRWEHDLFAAHQQVAAAFAAAETRFPDEPFWQRRRPAPAPRAGVAPSSPMLLRPSPALRRGTVLRRVGPEVEEVEGIVDSTGGDELSHLGYVPVAPLVAVFDVPRTLADATRLAGRDPRLFVLPPRAVGDALGALVNRGWLVPASVAAGSH
jgi:flavin-dependent dehydrogenase